jgi:hypothetical protein
MLVSIKTVFEEIARLPEEFLTANEAGKKGIEGLEKMSVFNWRLRWRES